MSLAVSANREACSLSLAVDSSAMSDALSLNSRFAAAACSLMLFGVPVCDVPPVEPAPDWPDRVVCSAMFFSSGIVLRVVLLDLRLMLSRFITGLKCRRYASLGDAL